jgi:hypothetical protein
MEIVQLYVPLGGMAVTQGLVAAHFALVSYGISDWLRACLHLVPAAFIFVLAI